MTKSPWFAVMREVPPARRTVLTVIAFLLPLAVWSVISYVPWVWHPLVRVADPGASTVLAKDQLVPRELFVSEVAKTVAAAATSPTGTRANPVFLPEPHRVAIALWTAFETPPVRRGDPWLHQSLWHSCTIILWGFLLSAVVGIPLGVLCGALPTISRLFEPFVDFIRYMPAPAFGALCVAVLGINDGPKIAIIFVGTFFQMVLVIANTTRLLDRSLLEAAQTLGADNRRLLTRVVLPGIMPNLYSDLRILLGWAWTYLIVAELIGASSGISWFINQQGKYRNYENVYAGIILIGLVGLMTDQVLAFLGRFLFPWQGQANGKIAAAIFWLISAPIRLPILALIRLREDGTKERLAKEALVREHLALGCGTSAAKSHTP